MNTEEGKGFLRLYTWFEKCQTGLSRSYLCLRGNSREIPPIHALSTTFFLLLSFELPVLDIYYSFKDRFESNLPIWKLELGFNIFVRVKNQNSRIE